jgi:tRNA (adenine22-N1)-methyltransferase
MMELSKRLELIASMIDRCGSIVDVGTDHGYIPIYLIQKGICDRAVASDINKGPVEKAARNIQSEKLQDKIQCRLGSGLSTVVPGEVDGAIIAGMGGNLIRDIIIDDFNVFKELSFTLLQPVQNPEVLRQFIYESGFDIIDEELCIDESKYYEIIKVRYGNSPKVLSYIDYEISPVLIEKRHPLLKEFVQYKLRKYEKILNAINEDTELACAKKEIVKDKIRKIEELLLCL